MLTWHRDKNSKASYEKSLVTSDKQDGNVLVGGIGKPTVYHE